MLQQKREDTIIKVHTHTHTRADKQYEVHLFKGYRKSSMKPPGRLFDFGPSRGRGGLIREWDLFTKSNDKEIFGSFQFFYPIFC